MVQEGQAVQKILEKDHINATLVNCRFIKPLDKNLLFDLAQHIPNIITLEENTLPGGFGSAVLELLADHQIFPHRFHRIGLPDHFIEHGSATILREKYGLNADAIARVARNIVHPQHPADVLDAVRVSGLP